MSNISISQRVGAEINFSFFHPWHDKRGGKKIYQKDNFKYGAYSPIYPCANNRHWAYSINLDPNELCAIDVFLLVSNKDPEDRDIFDISHPQEVKNAYLKTSFEVLFKRQIKSQTKKDQNVEGILNYKPLNYKYCRFWIRGVISKRSKFDLNFRLYS